MATRDPKTQGKVKTAVYLTEPVARGLRLLAAAEGRSQSEIAEAALGSYLRERQETADWAKSAEKAFQFWDNPVDAEYDAL